MSTVRAGLIQMNLKGDTDQGPAAIRKQMLTAHLPLIDRAGAEGVQVPGRARMPNGTPRPNRSRTGRRPG